MQKIVRNFTYTGTTQTFAVPFAVSEIFIQAWGAAGGSSGHVGGPGGYSQGGLNVLPNETYNIVVGQGGVPWAVSQTQAILPTFGGGGAGGNAVGEQYKGSSGGGRSAIRNSLGTEILTAGGGGGSDSSWAEAGTINGGPGGGSSGVNGYVSVACYNIMMGKGGTQTAGGAGGTGWTAFNNGAAGTAFTGGAGGGGSNGGLSAGAAGGGGGGYFGGGGGAGEYQAGLGCPPAAGSQDCAAGGGSGYIGGVFSGVMAASTTPGTSPFNPPYNTNANYIAGVGVAAANSVGGNGLVVLTYTIPTLTKSVDKQMAGIGDIINYTVVLDNTSGITLNNIVFVDTIPNGTAFINNSLVVNGNAVAGSPAPPGVSLGNILNVITINYSVQVITVPSPNPVQNIGTISATNFTTANSNTVVTTINYLNLTSSKTVNKSYANIGDILTYTIPIKNNGNSTANNIVLIDTIPNGTSLVSGSLKQDGTSITGSPNIPGVTLPNSLAIGKVSTITFQVIVTTTPNPNPIQNTAAIQSSFIVDSITTPNRTGIGATNTNVVTTQINYAALGGASKAVDKAYATCKEVLNYTIIIPNYGTTTAQNVIFKDTIPSGTVFLNNSVYINGGQQIGYNPSSGITIPNIGPGMVATVNFQVQVNC